MFFWFNILKRKSFSERSDYFMTSKIDYELSKCLYLSAYFQIWVTVGKKNNFIGLISVQNCTFGWMRNFLLQSWMDSNVGVSASKTKCWPSWPSSAIQAKTIKITYYSLFWKGCFWKKIVCKSHDYVAKRLANQKILWSFPVSRHYVLRN